MSLDNAPARFAAAPRLDNNNSTSGDTEERQQMHQVKMQAQYQQGLLDPLNPVKFQEQTTSAPPMTAVKVQEQGQQQQQAVQMARPLAAASAITNDEKAGIPPIQVQQIPPTAPNALLSGGGGGGGHEIPVALEIRHPAVTGFTPLSVIDAYALHLVLGFFGAHHFRMGRYTMGCIYLCTVAGFGLGWVVDLFRMYELVEEFNRREGRFEGNESKAVLTGDGYALWILGFFGVTHAYFQRPGWAVFYLCTCGGFGVGVLFDLFRMPSLAGTRVAMRNGEYKKYDAYLISDAYVTWMPAGLFGAHHFYLGNTGRGFLYLFTVGLFGVGWIIDGFRIPTLVKEANARSGFQANLQNAPEARIV